MKRLFEVSIQKTLYVMAEDEREAEIEAKTYESEEDPEQVNAREVKSALEIPNEYMDSLPWGNEEGPELTLAQIMELPPPPAPPYDHPAQMKLPFSA